MGPFLFYSRDCLNGAWKTGLCSFFLIWGILVGGGNTEGSSSCFTGVMVSVLVSWGVNYVICLGCCVEMTAGGFWASLFLDKLFFKISRFVGLTITG